MMIVIEGVDIIIIDRAVDVEIGRRRHDGPRVKLDEDPFGTADIDGFGTHSEGGYGLGWWSWSWS